ncbi:MAG: hypothetical protein ABJC19_11280 [Gemmatimonadota bacterium]
MLTFFARAGVSAGALFLSVACSGSPAALDEMPPTGAPPGPDVTAPYAIDRGDAGTNTPGTYKGLWLRLVTQPAPTVTAVGGVVGVVCVGMSNANQECSALIQQLAGAWKSEVNPAVRVVNCAVGGNAIEKWIDPASDDLLWDDCINRKLGQGGVQLAQVRVIYHKAADQFTTGPGGAKLPLYPAAGSDYENFGANLSAFSARVKAKFPSVQAVFTSSRSYGGFSSGDRGEPLSYEEGHALNGWLATHARVDGVWYGWGAYLWAPDCSTGLSNGTNSCYDRADYQSDGVHPSPTGQVKIARMMHDRLRQEAWYRP